MMKSSTMSRNSNEMRQVWEDRQNTLGNTHRSVLFKGLPDWLNSGIHQQHTTFIKNMLDTRYFTVLDVGCGYGRISLELKQERPELDLEGVEICEGFASHFSACVGPCFNGSIQDFTPTRKYDAIIVVTVLMYLDESEISAVLDKLWDSLNTGGRLICIEPSTNILTVARQTLSIKRFEPTGSDVRYFHKNELENMMLSFGKSSIRASSNIGLLPLINVPVLHRAIAVTKTD